MKKLNCFELEEQQEIGAQKLRGNWVKCNGRRFQDGDEVEVLNTSSVRQRYAKTVGKLGSVVFSYYTINKDFRNYFVRVLVDNKSFASYFTSDLRKINEEIN